MAGSRGPNHGGVGDALASAERQIAKEGRRNVSVLHRADGERVFKSEEHVFANHRGSFDCAFHVRSWIGEVKQPSLRDGQILTGGADVDYLSGVSFLHTYDNAPLKMGGQSCHSEVPAGA